MWRAQDRLPGWWSDAYLLRVITFVSVVRVLLLLAVSATAISLVMGIARPETGATEKVVLVVLIGGWIYVARLITSWAANVKEHMLRA